MQETVTDKLHVEVRDSGGVALSWSFSKPTALVLPFQARAIGEAILRAADEAGERVPELAEDRTANKLDAVAADVDAEATEIEVGDVSLYERNTLVIATRTGEMVRVCDVTDRLVVTRGVGSQRHPLRAGDELYIAGVAA